MLRIAVAIPCHRVTQHVLEVIRQIPPEVVCIYAVDDACPDHSGQWITQHCTDPRVKVLTHEKNQGVGGPRHRGSDNRNAGHRTRQNRCVCI